MNTRLLSIAREIDYQSAVLGDPVLISVQHLLMSVIQSCFKVIDGRVLEEVALVV
jgi:hypothetical protein